MTGAWGEGDSLDEDAGESVVGTPIQLGDGISMTMNPEAFRKLLHHPLAVDKITQVGEAIKDAANDMAVTKGAVYDMKVQNRSDTRRARVRVWAKNFKAIVDDAYHSTLLKAMAMYPGDPKPDLEGPQLDEGELPEEMQAEEAPPPMATDSSGYSRINMSPTSPAMRQEPGSRRSGEANIAEETM